MHFTPNMVSDIIKLAFKLAAFGVFIYQIRNSFQLFLSDTIVQITSFDEIGPQQFYICFDRAFDYTAAEQIGYRSHSQFLAGKLESSSTLSWRGKYGNMSFDEMASVLYRKNSAQTNLYNSSRQVLNFLTGFCLLTEPIAVNVYFTIRSLEPFMVFLDLRNINFKTQKNPWSTLQAIRTGKDTFQYGVYEIIYSKQDDTLLDGNTCSDYDKINSSHSECFELAIEDYMKSILGCLPPWWPKINNLTCERDVDVKKLNSTAMNRLLIDLDDLSDRMDIGAAKNCKPDCKTIKVHTNVLHTIPDYPKEALMKVCDDLLVLYFTLI